jgi:hypothetical protein
VFGTPHIDLFAAPQSTKLSVCFSPLPESIALAVNAMSQSWDGMFAYTFPSTRFLTEVLHRVACSRCEVLLVAPCWSTTGMGSVTLVPARQRAAQGRHGRYFGNRGQGVFHVWSATLALHMWKLSGVPSGRHAFLGRCQCTFQEEA